MTLVLRARVSSSMPVPRPVTSVGALAVNQAMSAADAVVFPIPMSPVTSIRAPDASACAATSTPTSSAAAASVGVMAGSRARLPVPRRTVRRTSVSDSSGIGVATPTSTTTTRAPAHSARMLMAAPPEQKLATIWAVTSWGHGVTPSATTPWSPANTATVTGAGSGGGHIPAIAHSCTPMSSNFPSEPLGFVNRSWCSRAARAAPSSTGLTSPQRA